VTTLTGASPSFDAVGARPTLDQLLAGAWDGLRARDVVECPVCRGEMAPESSAGAFPSGGRCGACGSRLT